MLRLERGNFLQICSMQPVNSSCKLELLQNAVNKEMMGSWYFFSSQSCFLSNILNRKTLWREVGVFVYSKEIFNTWMHAGMARKAKTTSNKAREDEDGCPPER